jgi:UDP-glucose 4-epimerase
MSKLNILITGIAGLVGSRFAEYLPQEKYTIYGIDNLSDGYLDNIPSKVWFFNIDLLDYRALDFFFQKHQIDIIYHFAAWPAECASPFARRHNYNSNIICSANLINAAIQYDIKKFIFTSSMSVYGRLKPPFIETQIPRPIDDYGIAKYCVELSLEAAKEQFGLNFSIIRPHNIIGRNQVFQRFRNVISIWIKQILEKKDLTIYGQGEQLRAFSDISFYCEPFEKLIGNKYNSEIYNLGADKPIKIVEAANLLLEVAELYAYNKSKLLFLEPRHEVFEAWCSHEKAKKDLDFIDRTNLYVTFKEMFSQALNRGTNPPKGSEKFEFEVTKGLYSYWK